ncbi:hypothetical protein [Fibrivirga algicola]|nr:hypothetical protein [Fibrivirga algicola]
MKLQLDSRLANKCVYPAIGEMASASGSGKEDRMRGTRNNEEFLISINR